MQRFKIYVTDFYVMLCVFVLDMESCFGVILFICTIVDICCLDVVFYLLVLMLLLLNIGKPVISYLFFVFSV